MSNVGPIPSGHGSESTPPPESQAERQKLFNLQWEISLIGTYVAVSNKNGNVEDQLNHMKQSMTAGEPPEKLVASLNQLTQQLGLPSFHLLAGTEQFVHSVERVIKAAVEKGKLSEKVASHLLDQLSEDLGSDATQRLNTIIESANQALPSNCQLPTFKC